MGQIFVIGIVTPRNGADEDAVFQRVQSSDSDAVQGLELRFAGRCPVGSAYGWPTVLEQGLELRVSGSGA
jgi:hypothetical protein